MHIVMSSNESLVWKSLQKFSLSLFLLFGFVINSFASDFSYPWRNKQKAIIIDAYEKNPIDWHKMVKNKQIRAFIGKASDGLASPWACSGNTTERKICKKSFQNYFMKQQLYHTRKTLAKALGLKWGAYHLGRPGNPIAQANHFLNFAKPEKDELIALDIEHDDPKKWISFKDAEIFVRHIYKRIGRYPVLYTNHNTAQRIAARRDEFPILSRMQLWYARFKGDVRGAFPMGNWDKYTLWQFSAHPNCNKRRCLYRVPGTPTNIDVNVSTLNISEFDKAWPFDGLVPVKKPKKKSDPNILLVKNEKPEFKVENTQIITASVVAPKIETKSDLPQSKEASFQLAGINISDIVVPTARERETVAIPVARERETIIASVEAEDITSAAKPFLPTDILDNSYEEKPSYGITTTDYEQEYELVIPKSEHAEDLTMQLQYVSGAL